MKSLAIGTDNVKHGQLGAIPTHLHTANSELDLARTVAASLHLARSEAQLVSRIAMVRECCAMARQAALIGNLPHLVAESDALLSALDAALLPVEQQLAA